MLTTHSAKRKALEVEATQAAQAEVEAAQVAQAEVEAAQAELAEVEAAQAVQTEIIPEIRIPTVDEIVNNIALYIKLCEEQSVVFRLNVEEFMREYDLYTQSADVAKPGQSRDWKPTPHKRDAFVAEMKRRCQEVPNSIADRVKLYYAAHAILMCTIFVDMAQHSQAAQREILAKSNKKCHKDLIHEGLMLPQLPMTQMLPSVNILMRSNPNPPKRLLTAEDYTLFTGDPTTLPDKQFLLNEGEGCESLYEVTEVRFLKGSWVYLVRFEGCHDCVTVPGQEMTEMLQRSSLVEGK